MAKDTEQETVPYENPNQKTGYWDDNSHVTMFDPNTGEYITKKVDPDNIFEFNPKNDQTSWGMVDGERTLIYTGNGGYLEGGMEYAGDNNWDWVYGAPPNVSDTPPPLTNGMDRETGGQVGGDPNWVPPEPVDKWAPDPTEPPTGGGGTTPGYEFDPDRETGTGGGGGGDPFTPPTGGGDTGGGGGGTAPPIDWGDLFDIPLQGWEASTNKDFYQDQFRDMRMRREGEGIKEFAAAIRRQESENAPTPEMGDPWAWAGGESQFTPTVGTGFDATWTMPDRYLNQDNASIIAMQGNDYLSKHPDFLAQAPDFTLENREDVLSYLNSNPYTRDKGWVQAVNDLGRGLYTQLGDTVGGLPVPEGYASPI